MSIQFEVSLKKYGILTIICVLIGFFLFQLSVFLPYVPILLAILVFFMIIEHEIYDFKLVIKHPRNIISLIYPNFILYPLIGFLLVYFVYPAHEISTGIIFLCFVTSPVLAAIWTEMSGGDVSISISSALLSMLLSIGIYNCFHYITDYNAIYSGDCLSDH